MQDKYGNKAPLTVTRGKVYEYLGMTIDYSDKGMVKFTMLKYVEDILKECPADLIKGTAASPAANHLFEINDKPDPLDDHTAEG